MVAVDMLAHAIDNPAPSTVMIITGDRDFAYAMSILRLRSYRVILITLANAHPSLTAQSSFWLDWVTEILEPAAASTGFSKQVRSDSNPSDRNAYLERSMANKALPEQPYSFRKGHETMAQSPPNRTNVDLGQLHHSATQRRATVNGFPNDLSSDSGQSRNRHAIPRIPMQNTGNAHYSPLPSGTFNNLIPATPFQFQSSRTPLVIGQITLNTDAPPQSSTIKDSVGHLPTNVASKKTQYATASTSTYHSPVPLKHSKALQTSPPLSPILTKDASVLSTHEDDYSPPSISDSLAVRPSSAPSIMSLPSQAHSEEYSGASSTEAPSNSKDKTESLYKSMISGSSNVDSGVILNTKSTDTIPLSKSGSADKKEKASSISSMSPTDKFAASQNVNSYLPPTHGNSVISQAPVSPASIPVPSIAPPINTATLLRPTAPPFSPSTAQEILVVPEIFKILVEILQRHLLKGKSKPTRSVVAVELSQNGSTYKKAGVVAFKQYAALAKDQGIIELGGKEGDAWISLCPKWHNTVSTASQ